MTNWKQLEKDVSNWLSSLSTKQIIYRNPYQAIIGYPTTGFRSDGMLTNDSVLLAVEIEAGQKHPDTNVGKYWLLDSKYKQYQKIVLFHIFTPDYNSYGWRMELAKFYAEKMKNEVPIDYILLDYRREEDYNSTLFMIKSEILKKAMEYGLIISGN